MNTIPVPQANNISLVVGTVLAVGTKGATASKVSKKVKLSTRQSEYYLSAAGSLNLITRSKQDASTWVLTPKGTRFFTGDADKRASILRRSVKNQAHVKTLHTTGYKGLNRQLKGLSLASRTRRVSTISAWHRVATTPIKVLAASL